jgi:Tfp pilus assembly protein PilV
MRKLIFIIAGIALTASLSSYAQNSGGTQYRWHDGQGSLHYSNSLTSEAMQYGYDVVNDQGVLVGHVQRQLTPDERAAANKLAQEQAAQRKLAEEHAREEQQMLDAYPNEGAFRTKQQDALDTIDQQMDTTRVNLRSQEKALTDLLARAGDLERAKQPVPKFLADSISSQRGIVADQRAVLEHMQQVRDKTVASNAAQLQRYRELKAAQAQPSGQ